MSFEILGVDLYHILSWFIVYSFMGWIWESCYVSAKSKKWVNRGFVSGPFVTIYGVGAVTVYVILRPVAENILELYFAGVAVATILEYVTGAAMERLFRVRYWDYSKHKFNLNGHICLGVSLGWGLFAVFLVKGIHLPIESLILQIPPLLGDILATILVVVMAVDVTASFNEAMDLKETLIRLSESREQIARLQRRLEIISTVAIDDINRKKQERSEKRLSQKQMFLERVRIQRELRQKQLEELQEKLEELQARGKERKEAREEYQRQIAEELQRLGAGTDKIYGHAARHLRRNPSIMAEKYTDAIREIRELLKKKE